MRIKILFNQCVSLSEKWLIIVAFLWCSVSLVVGLLSVDDLGVAIAAPLMTIFMFFIAMGMVMGVIGFQRSIDKNSTNSNFIKLVTIGAWVFGIFAFLNFLWAGVFDSSEFEYFGFFMTVASVFPLGMSLGAAKTWKQFCVSK